MKKTTASGKVTTKQRADAPYMGFAASCLTICETCCHASFKNGLHQRFGREPIETTGHNINFKPEKRRTRMASQPSTRRKVYL